MNNEKSKFKIGDFVKVRSPIFSSMYFYGIVIEGAKLLRKTPLLDPPQSYLKVLRANSHARDRVLWHKLTHVELVARA